jgi:hypothetical protein
MSICSTLSFFLRRRTCNPYGLRLINSGDGRSRSNFDSVRSASARHSAQSSQIGSFNSRSVHRKTAISMQTAQKSAYSETRGSIAIAADRRASTDHRKWNERSNSIYQEETFVYQQVRARLLVGRGTGPTRGRGATPTRPEPRIEMAPAAHSKNGRWSLDISKTIFRPSPAQNKIAIFARARTS